MPFRVFVDSSKDASMMPLRTFFLCLLTGLVVATPAWADCDACSARAASAPVLAKHRTAPLPFGGYWARVVRVTPVRMRYEEPIEVSDCHLEGRSRGTAEAVVGAVAGGLIGSTVGAGLGRNAAIAGGAAVGGVVGQAVSRRDPEAVCGAREIWRTTRTALVYDVAYRSGLTGDLVAIRLDREPGSWVWVDVSTPDPWSDAYGFDAP